MGRKIGPAKNCQAVGVQGELTRVSLRIFYFKPTGLLYTLPGVFPTSYKHDQLTLARFMLREVPKHNIGLFVCNAVKNALSSKAG